MKIKAIFLLSVLIITLSGLTNKLYSQAGGSSVPFLLITPDARASSMGETGTAYTDDINAVYWNPAGLGFLDYVPRYNQYNEVTYEKYKEVSLAYSKWLPQFNADLFYSYLSGGMYLEEIDGTIAVNFVFMNLGEFTRTAFNGDVLGKFNSNEFTLGLSYGTIVAKDLGLGVNLRYIQSNLTPTSTAQQDAGIGRSASFDLGLMWKPQNLKVLGLPLNDRLSLGFNLKNVGPQITYINESDPLPTSLKLGAAYKLYQDEFNTLNFAFDFGKLLVYRDSTGPDPVPISFVTAWDYPGAEISMGMEWWYQQLFAGRVGYFSEPSVIGDRKYWTFGAGVRYDIFNLDFGFILTTEENHPLANTMRFSIKFDLTGL